MRLGNFDTAALTPEQFQRYASKQMRDLVLILNKGILINDNFDGTVVTVVFTSSNEDTRVTHNLNRTPTGYLALNLSAAMIVYSGSVAAGSNEITLKSSAAGTALMFIF